MAPATGASLFQIAQFGLYSSVAKFFGRKRSIRQWHTSRECHAIGGDLGLVACLEVGLELSRYSALSHLRGELAANREILTAVGTAPGDGSPVNFF